MNLDNLSNKCIDTNISVIPSEVDTSFYIKGVNDFSEIIKYNLKQLHLFKITLIDDSTVFWYVGAENNKEAVNKWIDSCGAAWQNSNITVELLKEYIIF